MARERVPRRKHEKHEKDIERAFFGKMYFRMSDVADTMFFSAKKYQEIVVFFINTS